MLLLVALLIARRVLLDSRYMRFNAHIFLNRGVFRSVAANIGYHTAEWGEMTANAPASKLPAALGLPLQILGAFAIFACVVGIWVKRDRPDSLLVYVLGFGCIVFAYPWNDSRLWLPVLPFLMGYVLPGLRRMVSPGMLRPLLVVYCSLFCMLGLLALGFILVSRSLVRGSQISMETAISATPIELCFVARSLTTANDVNQDALYLLRRYEWRASSM
ncbi:MAG: hypothetical protein WA741_33085 [Candidatus Sulfotelmatobacter sp.]